MQAAGVGSASVVMLGAGRRTAACLATGGCSNKQVQHGQLSLDLQHKLQPIGLALQQKPTRTGIGAPIGQSMSQQIYGVALQGTVLQIYSMACKRWCCRSMVWHPRDGAADLWYGMQRMALLASPAWSRHQATAPQPLHASATAAVAQRRQ
jgi:hypothetical protein